MTDAADTYRDTWGTLVDPPETADKRQAAIDDWCKLKLAQLKKSMDAFVLSGGDIADPLYRLNLGQHIALQRIRSFLSGSRKYDAIKSGDWKGQG